MIIETMEKEGKNIIFVYTTCSSLEEAKDIGFSAVNEKIAISADYWLVNSIYPWKGVIQEGDQYMLLIATQKSRSEELIKHIETRHSYEVPVIAIFKSIMTSQMYGFWVDNTLTNKDKYISETEAEAKNQAEGYHYSRLK